MDDARCREFFSQPTQTYHRRYEALRAIFIEGRSHQEVAEQFGFERGTVRQLVSEFREQCCQPRDASPFFVSRKSDDPRSRRCLRRLMKWRDMKLLPPRIAGS
jgi:transposase